MTPPAKTALSSFTYPVAGESSERPQGLSWREAGIQFFDQSLQLLLVWNGERWVTAWGEDSGEYEGRRRPQPVAPTPEPPESTPEVSEPTPQVSETVTPAANEVAPDQGVG